MSNALLDKIVLDKIADVILAYRPKEKQKKARKRKKARKVKRA
jgi:hypothetical protein